VLYCGASIGASGLKFCTCVASMCTKSSHNTSKKLLIEGDTLYIMCRKAVASIAVCLKLAELPIDQSIDGLLKKAFKSSVWSAFFLRCQESAHQFSPDSTNKSWVQTEGPEPPSVEEFATAKNVARKFTFGKTPEKAARGGADLGPSEPGSKRLHVLEDVGDMLKEVEVLPSDPLVVSRIVRRIIADWPNVQTNFGSLHEKMTTTHGKQSSMNEEFLDGMDELADEFNTLKNYIKVFQGELGPEELRNTGSIWEHILEITDGLVSVR
jgi:hypothetical protein